MLRNYHEAPDPAVLFYQRVDQNGRKEVATIQSLTTDGMAWRALFRVPGQAEFIMDQYNSELDQWEPVYALTQDDISTLIERVAQPVTELMQDQAPSTTVTAAMSVLTTETVQEAVDQAVKVIPTVDPFEVPTFDCKCGKSYKHKKTYTKHKKKCKV